MVIISDVNLLRNLKYLDHERNQNSSVGCFFGMDATTAALIGICFLLCTSVLGWDDIKSEKAAWDKLVWFSSLVMMGSFLNSLGFTKWLGQLIGARIHGMSPTMGFIVLSALYGYTATICLRVVRRTPQQCFPYFCLCESQSVFLRCRLPSFWVHWPH